MIKSEDTIKYGSNINDEDAIIEQALSILAKRCKRGATLSSPTDARNYLSLQFGELEHEIFGCIFLNTKNQVIEFETMFQGTVDGASVYPREVVKRALHHNATGCIFYHNHPSGGEDPSQADIRITERLKQALALVGVKVLDHVIVAGSKSTAFSERGLI